jgi:metal-dependent HD superfamily phosphatase/phosphodiesterase
MPLEILCKMVHEKPIQIAVSMSSEVGIFQVEGEEPK